MRRADAAPSPAGRDSTAVTLYDCLVIGGGPAGASAAIYLARFNRSVLVLDHGSGRSTTHEVNENYLGFPKGIAARRLRKLGREQAERFGAEFLDCRVEEAARSRAGYRVTAEDGREYAARTLILATGVTDKLPEFENKDVNQYFGRSLFWCITCDGHKARDARVAVVGADDQCATTALQFLNFTKHVVVITNRPPGESELSRKKRGHLKAANIRLYESRIGPIRGEDGFMRAVVLPDGRRLKVDYMFNQQGARPNSLLARRLGVKLDADGYIKVDNEQRTNVGKLYAAGDVTKAFAHQVVTAAHEGATAGQAANYDLYRPDQKEAGP